jgi:predicted nucleic acid-binding protein
MALSVLHLDTNVLIFAMQPEHPAHQHIAKAVKDGSHLATSSMAWAEFCCGPVTSEAVQAWQTLLAGRILAVDQAIAALAADLFNKTGRRSRSLPDCLIAATAIHHKAPLVTLNHQDFALLVPFGLDLV